MSIIYIDNVLTKIVNASKVNFVRDVWVMAKKLVIVESPSKSKTI